VTESRFQRVTLVDLRLIDIEVAAYKAGIDIPVEKSKRFWH